SINDYLVPGAEAGIMIPDPGSRVFIPESRNKIAMPQTLYDKLWSAHVVHQESDGTCLLYIDRHLLHEVTSLQAFEGLAIAGRRPWRTGANLAVADHNVPTINRAGGSDDPSSRLQSDTLDANCDTFGITNCRT